MRKGNVNEQLVLVINSGSSSIKYEVISFSDEISMLHGEVSDIGPEHAKHLIYLKELGQQELAIEDDSCELQKQADGFNAMLAALSRFHDTIKVLDFSVIGHRVVHGETNKALQVANEARQVISTGQAH